MEKVHLLQAQKSKVFAQKIQQYMIANAYLGPPSLNDVAANFNMTARSLQRKLQDEGVSFLQLTNEVMKSLALHYMQSGVHPIKEVSHMLGYNELSAFSRAFKRWTGKAPANYFAKRG
jgi:AraC-like DNA-binding protein